MSISDPIQHGAESPISAMWSVNETTQRYPVTLSVFRAFRVDTCCGGGATIAEAARMADLPLDDLLHALTRTAHVETSGDAMTSVADPGSC